MNWVALIFAAAAAIAAALFWWGRSRTGRELALMMATPTSSVRDIARLVPGTLVEVKGQLKTAAPLTAEFSGRACVYYRALTEREVEKTTTDSDGKRETSREFETESDVVRFAPAMIEDATGEVALDFKDAKVEGEQVHQRREDVGLGTSLLASLAGAGTTAHRFTEWIVAGGIPVYVLATVSASHTIGADAAGKNPFVISIKSEEERERTLGRTKMWQSIATVILGLIALALLYVALTSGPVQTSTP
ncbi:MAG: GIDE domain-containing protein [Bauldia sp.]